MASADSSRLRIAPRAINPAAAESHGIEIKPILRGPSDSACGQSNPNLIRNFAQLGISRHIPLDSENCIAALVATRVIHFSYH